MTLKAIIDGFGTHNHREYQWPPVAGINQRLGAAIETQYLDAAALCLSSPEAYAQVSRRWSRKNQSGQNKVTNIKMGQDVLINESEWARHELKFPWGAKSDLASRLIDYAAQVGLCERVGLQKKRQGRNRKQNEVTLLRPTEAVMARYAEVLDDMATGRLMTYPMVEQPLPWEFLPDQRGVKNQTGGFHNQQFRETHPAVRTRWDDNATVPSELLIELLNLLGSVGFTPDKEIADAFAFAVASRMEIDSVNNLPLKTVADLDREGALDAASIEETGMTLDGISPVTGGERWKNRNLNRKIAYEDAIEAMKKFTRTRQSLLASKTVQNDIFDTCYFAWSACYRGRAYPIQTLLTPQGPSVEKVIMRFADGEQITTQQQRDEIHTAIGAAFLGRRYRPEELEAKPKDDRIYGRTDAELRQWGEDNIKQILSGLTGDGSDIINIDNLGADEPWDALALCNAYRRTFHEGKPWDVGISIDASQSGLQILSSSLRDEESMLATNVISALFDDKWGPVDGYRFVVERALQLLNATDEQAEEMGVDPDWIKRHKSDLPADVWAVVSDVFKHSNSRKAAKKVCMPLVYGAKLPSMMSGVREVLPKLGFKLDELFLDRGEDRFQYQHKVVTEVTCYLYQAACLVYPKVMQSLSWLSALASKSIRKQVEEHKAQHAKVNEEARIQFLADENNDAEDWEVLPLPDFMPKVEWTLSDGTVCSYWETKLLTQTVHSLEFGRYEKALDQGPTPSVKVMISAFAPGWTHSIDALLLRTALKDWDIEKLGPVTSIHDCIKVLPSALPELRQRLQSAMREVIEANPIHDLAAQMGVSLDELPVMDLGEASLDDISDRLFH